MQGEPAKKHKKPHKLYEVCAAFFTCKNGSYNVKSDNPLPIYSWCYWCKKGYERCETTCKDYDGPKLLGIPGVARP